MGCGSDPVVRRVCVGVAMVRWLRSITCIYSHIRYVQHLPTETIAANKVCRLTAQYEFLIRGVDITDRTPSWTWVILVVRVIEASSHKEM